MRVRHWIVALGMAAVMAAGSARAEERYDVFVQVTGVEALSEMDDGSPADFSFHLYQNGDRIFLSRRIDNTNILSAEAVESWHRGIDLRCPSSGNCATALAFRLCDRDPRGVSGQCDPADLSAGSDSDGIARVTLYPHDCRLEIDGDAMDGDRDNGLVCRFGVSLEGADGGPANKARLTADITVTPR